MFTIGKILKSLRDKRDATQKEVAISLGVTRDVVANWETDRAMPGSELLPRIADYFSVTTDYLLGRSGSPQVRLPILGNIRAGLPILADENIEGYLDVPETIKADYVLRVTGDSMIGAGILEGDYAICRDAQTANSGQIVVGIKDIDTGYSEATLKFYYDTGNDKGPVLRPANPNYQEIGMSEGYRIAGILVAIIRQDAPGAQVYRDYLTIAGHEEWTDVIEKAAAAGIKPGHLAAYIDMMIGIGRNK